MRLRGRRRLWLMGGRRLDKVGFFAFGGGIVLVPEVVGFA